MSKIMPDYQLRVVAERDELRDRLERLETFIQGPKFPEVNVEEQHRLQTQADAMQLYLNILIDRIGNF